MPHAIFFALAIVAVSGTSPAGDDAQFFESRIRPILAERCEKCHGESKQKGNLRLDTKTGWARGGDRGPAIIPGKPDDSPLIQAILRKDDDLKMPPDKSLSDREVADLVEWVKRGASDPREGGKVKIGGMNLDDAKNWWSLKPVTRPAVPTSSAENPIDAFLNAKMGTLEVAGPADKRTLIRRATYDLTGLPPTTEEVEAFVKDDSPDAFAKVIDRLLSSPHYGKRWGKHWLDLARYADTAGENSDHPLPHAWRYRNWVIDAFNRDLPYDEFVRQQIAGDLMTKDVSPQEADGRVVATGFLAIARRFGHDINKDVHLTIEDAIDTTTKTVLGMTVGCARCHNHKYDPISAEDYYALYGILSSTRLPFPGCEPAPLPKDLVPLPSDPKSWGYSVAEGTSADAKLQQRGDPEKPGIAVKRRWLEVLGGQPVPEDGGSGRKALAGWMTSNDNPLTARVMVNRIWQGHFGQGIVTTPSDFGTRGAPPSHPELLDWLASEFMSTGWHMKAMHKNIMLSDAYKRSSVTAGSETDPDNVLHARFDRQRLSAEELRDSILVAADTLDRASGGAFPFPPEKDWHYTQHEPFSASYPTPKRSVYQIVIRNRRDPYFALFDGADPNASTPQRQDTTVPTQALFFLNSAFVHEQSGKIADRVLVEKDDPKRLDRLFAILYQRSPTDGDRARAAKFLASYSGEVPEAERLRASWAALTRVLIGSNEFLYVD